jgi:hypothetical protein
LLQTRFYIPPHTDWPIIHDALEEREAEDKPPSDFVLLGENVIYDRVAAEYYVRASGFCYRLPAWLVEEGWPFHKLMIVHKNPQEVAAPGFYLGDHLEATVVNELPPFPCQLRLFQRIAVTVDVPDLRRLNERYSQIMKREIEPTQAWS